MQFLCGCQSLHITRNIAADDSFAVKASGLNVELGSGGISRKVGSPGQKYNAEAKSKHWILKQNDHVTW